MCYASVMFRYGGCFYSKVVLFIPSYYFVCDCRSIVSSEDTWRWGIAFGLAVDLHNAKRAHHVRCVFLSRVRHAADELLTNFHRAKLKGGNHMQKFLDCKGQLRCQMA